MTDLKRHYRCDTAPTLHGSGCIWRNVRKEVQERKMERSLFEISESVGDTKPEHRGRLPRRGAFPTGMGKERPPPQDSASSKRDKMSQAVTTPVNMPSWPPGTALASSTANEIRKKYPVGSVWYEPDEPREGEELAPTFL